MPARSNELRLPGVLVCYKGATGNNKISAIGKVDENSL